MALTLEVAYDSAAGLLHDWHTQLEAGGLFVTVTADEPIEPLTRLRLLLVVDGVARIGAPARVTVANPRSMCVELMPEARDQVAAGIAQVAAPPQGASKARRSVTLREGGETPIPQPVLLPAAPSAAAARQTPIPQPVTAGAPAPAAPPAATPPPRAAAPPATSDERQEVLSIERRIAALSVSERVKLALHGSRDERVLLARDRTGVVQSSLVRNPKMTLDEVLALARSAHLAPDAAETIAEHPQHGTSPQIALALVRNPRTPLPLVTRQIALLQVADLRTVAKGMGVRLQVAQAARKRLLGGDSR